MGRFSNERNKKERDGREIEKFSGLDVERDKKRKKFYGVGPTQQFSSLNRPEVSVEECNILGFPTILCFIFMPSGNDFTPGVLNYPLV